jgi:hypothetical protein
VFVVIMTEKNSLRSRLKETVIEHAPKPVTAFEHAALGAVVGAGIIAKETASVGKRTVEITVEAGKGVARTVYNRATHHLSR